MSRQASVRGPRRGLLLAVVASAALIGCSEKPQELSAARKSDVQSWQGGAAAYNAPGWKPGDQASWEAQIRSRNQNQNEYSRAPATTAAAARP